MNLLTFYTRCLLYINYLFAAYLRAERCNVICVDWKQLTYDLFYASAKINVKYIGYNIAKVLKILTNNMKVGSENIHLIGHSMGAHIVGYTGKKLNGQISRITSIYSIYYTYFIYFFFKKRNG